MSVIFYVFWFGAPILVTGNEFFTCTEKHANPAQFKAVASIRNARTNQHECTATIINRRALVTAANCRGNLAARKMIVVVGALSLDSGEGVTHRVKSFIPHEKFNPKDYTYDIALVILKEPIIFNDLVQLASLITFPLDPGTQMILADWGVNCNNPAHREFAKDLYWRYFYIVSERHCSTLTSHSIEGMICIQSWKGLCVGDAGGPLLTVRGELVGVGSSNEGDCGVGQTAIFFTNVTHYNEWIVETIVEQLY